MNVCALDVVNRTPDFESLASSLELRGWEWDLLHAVDGVKNLGTVSKELEIDHDSAIGFVHEAIHRGLLGVATMSLQAYRMRTPQAALASPPRKPFLTTTPRATPVLDAAPAAPSKPGTISFSVNALDWNEPIEPAEAVADPQPAPSPETANAHVGGVHYDDRFGVEHPGGPFAHEHADTAAPVSDGPHAEAPEETQSKPAASGIAAVAAAVAGASAVAFEAVVQAVTRPVDEPVSPEPDAGSAATPSAPVAADVPVADAPLETRAGHAGTREDPRDEATPSQISPRVDDPFAVATATHAPATQKDATDASYAAVDDPFAPVHVEDPFARTPASRATTTATPDDEPFAPAAHDTASFVASTHDAESPVAAEAGAEASTVADHDAEPFAAATHDAEPFAVATHDAEPFAAATHDAEPVAAATHDAEPLAASSHDAVRAPAAAAPIALSFGEDAGDEFGRSSHDEPLSQNGRAAIDAFPEESTPGSISFSFSALDQLEPDEIRDEEDAHEVYPAPVHAAAPATIATYLDEPGTTAVAAPEPAFPDARTIEHRDEDHPKSTGATQATYFEREAIDTDANREIEHKAKNWKESLSWREQQTLNEAMESGKEKTGVIGSLLRALGVR